MQFYMVSWHDPHSRYSGWDLVYAQNKREARRLYKQEHYLPVHSVASMEEEASREPQDGGLFCSVTPEEFERARRGEVVTIEEGT